MKLAFEEIIINPEKPCMQCGYVQRDHPYETVHDDVKAVNTEDDPENVVPVSGPGGTVDNGKAEIRIPALSWNVICFERQ